MYKVMRDKSIRLTLVSLAVLSGIALSVQNAWAQG